jgi:MFS family permease
VGVFSVCLDASTVDGAGEGREGWYWEALAGSGKLLYWVVVLFVVYFIFTPMALVMCGAFNDRAGRKCRTQLRVPVLTTIVACANVIGETLYILFSELKRMGVISAYLFSSASPSHSGYREHPFTFL